jgi:DNA polymerase-3 subunit gamma/tau
MLSCSPPSSWPTTATWRIRKAKTSGCSSNWLSSGSRSFRIKKKISELLNEEPPLLLPLEPVNQPTSAEKSTATTVDAPKPVQTDAPKPVAPTVKTVPPVTDTTGTGSSFRGSTATAPVGVKKESGSPLTLQSLQTVSLKKKQEELESKPRQEEEETLLLNQPFTPDALQRSWNIFIETIQDDIHLVNAMRSCPPVLKDDYVVEVTVQNQPLEKKFQDLTISLERHLHHHLKNNRIRLAIRLAEENELARPFTARDKLDAMIQKNPNMEVLYRTFGLDIN